MLYKIEGNPFLADMHFFHKAMKDVLFPTTKDKIIAQIGDEKVKMGWDKIQTVKEIISPLKVCDYASSAQFYNALIAQIYK